MANIKLEISFDSTKETLDQVISGLRASFIPTKDPNVYAVPQDSSKRSALKAEALDELKAETPATETPVAPSAKSENDDGEKPVSKTDVRALATTLSKAGKRDELAAIFAKFGGKKLSDISESDYPALMKEMVAANA